MSKCLKTSNVLLACQRWRSENIAYGNIVRGFAVCVKHLIWVYGSIGWPKQDLLWLRSSVICILKSFLEPSWRFHTFDVKFFPIHGRHGSSDFQQHFVYLFFALSNRQKRDQSAILAISQKVLTFDQKCSSRRLRNLSEFLPVNFQAQDLFCLFWIVK